MSDSVPDLLVEKLALGELSDAQAKDVRARLGADADARLQALHEDDERMLADLPPGEIADEVARRVKRADARERDEIATPRWTPWLATAGLAAAAVLLWTVTRPDATAPSDDGQAATAPDPGPTKIAKADPPAAADGGIRFKGGTKLKVFRNRGGEPERLDATSKVAAGDNLQLEYAAGDARLGVIVSIDGAGQATLHFPETESGNPSLRGQARLSHGYELDNAPGFERFIFVTTDGTDLSVADVMDAARALAASESPRVGAMALPAELSQQSLLLEK